MKHILQLLDHTVRRWGSRPAFGDEHRTLTWNEVGDAVQRIGTALAGYGVQRRPVAIYLDHEVPCLLAAALGQTGYDRDRDKQDRSAGHWDSRSGYGALLRRPSRRSIGDSSERY